MASRESCLRIKNRILTGRSLLHTLIGINYDLELQISSYDLRPSNIPAIQKTTRPAHAERPTSIPGIQKTIDDHAEGNQGVVITVAYGPLYRKQESATWKKSKEEAWNHVSRTTRRISPSAISEDEIYGIYVDAVRKVKEEALSLYYQDDDDRIIYNLSESEYVLMMIHDGCFLLLLILFILGREKKLKHILAHPVFGQLEGDKVSMIRDAVSSIFVVGNQIPLIVLKALMKQSFFKDVLNGGMWEQPIDLERWVLFELLLAPCMMDGFTGITSSESSIGIVTIIPTASLAKYLLARKNGAELRFFETSKRVALQDVPIDLLHGLWLLVSGLSQTKKDDSIEYIYVGEDDSTSRSDHIYDVVRQTVRGATELKEQGIVFRCNEGTKINGIKFKKVMFNATLIIPRLIVDSEQHLHMLLSNLIRYETTHFGQNQRKVCEYLQLMRELIRSPDDVKVLAASGVIIVDPDLEEKIPLLFRDLPIPKVMRSHGGSLRRVRDELNGYTRPSAFKKFGEVLTIVVFLSLVQTVYTMLSVHLKK